MVTTWPLPIRPELYSRSPLRTVIMAISIVIPPCRAVNKFFLVHSPNGCCEHSAWLATLGRSGGLIISPAQHVQLDTPVENFLAFVEALRGTPHA
jgi:hypothetical protein